jgi:hypothetical protein
MNLESEEFDGTTTYPSYTGKDKHVAKDDGPDFDSRVL